MLNLRDEKFSQENINQPSFLGTRKFQRDAEYSESKQKIAGLVKEYNNLAVELSLIEEKSPNFFMVRVRPMAPFNLRIDKEGTGLTWDPPPADPLIVEITNETRILFQKFGHRYPNDGKWKEVNQDAVTPQGYQIYYLLPTTNKWNKL